MRRRTHGITLIELMVVGITLMLVATGVFTLVTRAWANHETLLEQNLVQREARAALDMVCDDLRNLSPWLDSGIIGVSDPANSMVGRYQGDGSDFTISRNPNTNQLIRTSDSGVTTVVNNIAAFAVVYESRAPGAGSLAWQQITDMNNNPLKAKYDSRIDRVTTVYVSILASRTGLDGIDYHCTLTSAVKVRNQFYTTAPPLG